MINKEFPVKITKDELRRTAKHEVLHLLLWSMIEFAITPRISQDLMEHAEHAVIQRLMKVIN